MRWVLPTLLLMSASALAQQHIAPTPAKTPAEEQATFKLPPGFQAQLVAADPDIGKPIQIAFDARGRLWVTTSRHYPFAAEGTPSDKLYVLSDFAPTGKAQKVEVFASDLNIPIGVLPLPDGKSCLVSHIGSIVRYTDTDGDGKSDKKETILTGFGSRDTHGMMNSFVLLPDGWVYACHGFSNESVVKAKDGSEVRMQSGNTFRFRPDGSRVEPWTFGQVNPFGMTVDPWLNLYTADCHSKPITQLIRGSYYDSFGKPHDGLGYGPHVTRHDHGSTALCGLAWYQADYFPKEWDGCMFLGNVVTNRINVDRIEWKGGTPVAKELPDFMTSSDPWFRPTDIKLGPDGALYVADFYNKIIGHYEVDLKHPQRDKDRGRVWRIVYTGTDGKNDAPTIPAIDWANLSWRDLSVALTHKNLTVRLTAANEYARRLKAGDRLNLDLPPMNIEEAEPLSTAVGLATIAGEQVGSSELTPNFYQTVVKASRPTIESEPMKFTGLTYRGMNVRPSWGSEERGIAIDALNSFPKALHIRRAVIDGIIAHPHPEFIAPLVAVLQSTPAEDVTLRHATRIALRNSLRDPGSWSEADRVDAGIIADVAIGIPSKEAATFLLKQVKAGKRDAVYFERIGRYGDESMASAAVATLPKNDATGSTSALLALVQGRQAQGTGLPTESRSTAEKVCADALEASNPNALQSAVTLAQTLRAASLFEPLSKLAQRADRQEQLRGSAIEALIAINPEKAAPLAVSIFTADATPGGLRVRTAQALAGSNQPAARTALLTTLQTAPASLATGIAAALAGNPAGAEALLQAVKDGKASARLLQDKAVSTKLLAQDGGKLRGRIEELTRGLPSADARIDALIKNRATAYTKTQPDLARGKKIFTQHCAACHQVAGEGQKVGPQLDGIGNRGPDRLCEDILDSNRNVDAAFRATIITTVDGRTLTGLLLRQEGKVLVLADAMGKEVRIEEKDIEKRVTSPLSPMPANFDSAIPEADFPHLIGFLLQLRAKQ